jgi:hypothetical protein
MTSHDQEDLASGDGSSNNGFWWEVPSVILTPVTSLAHVLTFGPFTQSLYHGSTSNDEQRTLKVVEVHKTLVTQLEDAPFNSYQ